MTNFSFHPALKDAKWVFFDLDDTLYDFAACSLVALRNLYDANPIIKRGFADFNSFSNAYHAVNSELWRQYNAGIVSREYLKRERFERLLRPLMCHKEAKTLADKLDADYLRHLSEQGLTVENSIQTLYILSKHFLIGVISNGFINTQYRKLHRSGLNRYIQRMIVSDEIDIQKPAREIFDYALTETGADAETSVMIGDNPETDIKGALNAGWRAIFFNPYGFSYNGSTPQIRSLSELLYTGTLYRRETSLDLR